MKLFLVVLAIFGFAQLSFGQETPNIPDIEEFLRCVEQNFAEVETQTEEMLDFVMDVRETVVRLQGQRQRCIDIPRDDPPTALQSRAIQICETAFQASLAVEIARLTGRVRGNDNLMELFQGCIDSEPMTHAQLRQILKNVL